MADGMTYPKKVPKEVRVHIGDSTRVVSDALAYLSITPYFGCWAVDEVMPISIDKPAIAVVRTLAHYPSRELAQAYIEGFLAGEQKHQRKSIAELQTVAEAERQVNDE